MPFSMISLPAGVDLLDDEIGVRVAGAVCSHHARRLRNLGKRALDAPPGGWAEDAPPPRRGNRLDVLVDGEQMFGTLLEELSAARSHVHMTGWYMSPEFVLRHGDPPVVLRNLLADLAASVDVRVLLWAGSPAPVFTPSRRDTARAADELRASSDAVQIALDSHERPMHCHHEKTVVIDDRVAFVGGIDLTALSGDRLDTPAHPARAALGWHDVATRIEGPAVADVARHFAGRWTAVTGQPLPETEVPPPAGDVEIQIVRTMPERMYAGEDRGEFGILESYVRAIQAARQFIYIESQYLWSPEIAAVMAEKLAHPPDPRFRVVVLLPARPKGGGDDTRGVLGELMAADGGAGRLLATTLAARAGNAHDLIYVHAKVCIIDDAWLTIGSANLNDHSLFNDTEMNVVTHDPRAARDTRLRLWSEHLERPREQLAGDPCEVIDELWRPIAEEQRERLEEGRPLTHRLIRLPHVSRRTARLLGPLQGLLVDG
jgi:phosphatidylserine/phosphatidylglycerophosphate/cardiolipin synthase-like enzyme